jgi:hypothetical protein
MKRDLRRYAGQTTFRLVTGFVLILFLVGLGLIYVFYGPASAAFGLVCLVAGLAPLAAIWAILSLIEWLVNRAE